MRIDVGLPPCRELPCGAAAFFFGRFTARLFKPAPTVKGVRAAARAAPTAENGTRALVRQTQARNWNRTRSKFCKPRPPVGPEEPAPKHSWFYAPEIFCLA